MDKKFVMGIAAMAALTLVSCSSDDLDSFSGNSSKNEAISFDSYLGRSAVAVNGSRGSVLDNTTLKNPANKGFGVFGNYNADAVQKFGANFFNNENVTYSSSPEPAKWTYTNTKYWPLQGHIDFLAYAPYNSQYNNKVSEDNQKLAFTVNSKIKDQTDLLWANAKGQTKDNNPVKFTFNHALAKIGYTVKLKETYANATITLNKITLAGSATDLTKGAFFTDGTINLSKDLTNTEDATALWTDCKGEQYFTWSSDFPDVTSSSLASSDCLFVIPQDFSTGKELYVIVDYTINYTSVDPSTIKTMKYTVSRQIEKNFLQGKAYKINLSIGLTPIEFNADVKDWDPKEGESIDVSWN